MVLARPSHVLVMRATSAPVWSWMLKFQARQFSALIEPYGVAAGLEREADLADHVLLHDLADLGAHAVLHDDLRLHDLGRPGEGEQHVAVRVDDLQLVGHELVVGREHAQRLLGHALADLADRADLAAVLVVDGVLVVDLDELGLLVHDQDRLGEDRAAALRDAGRHAGLLATSLTTFSVARFDGRARGRRRRAGRPPGGRARRRARSTGCRPSSGARAGRTGRGTTPQDADQAPQRRPGKRFATWALMLVAHHQRSVRAPEDVSRSFGRRPDPRGNRARRGQPAAGRRGRSGRAGRVGVGEVGAGVGAAALGPGAARRRPGRRRPWPGCAARRPRSTTAGRATPRSDDGGQRPRRRRRRPSASDSAERSTPASAVIVRWSASRASAARRPPMPTRAAVARPADRGRRRHGPAGHARRRATAGAARSAWRPVGRGPSSPALDGLDHPRARTPCRRAASSTPGGWRRARRCRPPRPPPTGRAATMAPSRSATMPPQR